MKFFTGLWQLIKGWLDRSKEIEQTNIACAYLLDRLAIRDVQVIELTHMSEEEVYDSMEALVRQEPVNEGPAIGVEHFQGNCFKHILRAMEEDFVVGLK